MMGFEVMLAEIIVATRYLIPFYTLFPSQDNKKMDKIIQKIICANYLIENY